MVHLYFKKNGETYVSWEGTPRVGSMDVWEWLDSQVGNNILADTKAKKCAEIANQSSHHFDELLCNDTEIKDSRSAFLSYMGSEGNHRLRQLQLINAQYVLKFYNEIHNALNIDTVNNVTYNKDNHPLEKTFTPPSTPEA